MSGFLNSLLNLHGWAVYVIVGLLVFAEDALFMGFVLTGETAAILGGVAASRGHVSLILICIVVVAAAIVGYEIGRKANARLIIVAGGPRRRQRRFMSVHSLRREYFRRTASRSARASCETAAAGMVAFIVALE